MDTLTHALSGVLLAESVGRSVDARTNRAWLIAACVAAAFPDIDYVLLLLDPLSFLVLHRGPTHSVVLLPLWAALLALPLSRMLNTRWPSTMAACAVGLFAHIVGDWVTLYGTRLMYPLSERAYALGVSFDVNPWVALVTIGGFALGHCWRPRPAAITTLALIGILLAGQMVMRQQALKVAAEHARVLGIELTAAQALPQPLSPFHWALLLAVDDGYRLAYLELVEHAAIPLPSSTWVGQMLAAYRSSRHLAWTHHARPTVHALAREAWAQEEFAPFRRFAPSPALLRIEESDRETCVWFTDMRHRLPVLLPPFRYGLCRSAGASSWRPYWIRVFTVDVRHAL